MDLGARQGLAIRQRGVSAAVKIVARLDMRCEQPQLSGGASALALKARFRQAGLLGPDLGNGVCTTINFVGNPVEEIRPLTALRITIGPERIFGGATGGIDVAWIANRKTMGRAVGGA